jgi:uncharacterized membrane-anchored protein YjiN (DUF445 family)
MPMVIQTPEELSGHAEARAQRMLRRNRTLATGLLVGMIVLFVATEMIGARGFWGELVHAASEAGIVGGMADWFAVTALFRHPLGLPIPHTAILAHNKDRIGRALGRFIERSFLTPDVLLHKVREASYGSRLALWLGSPATARLLAALIANSLPRIIRALGTRELRHFVRAMVSAQLREADVAPVFGRALLLVTASGEADILFDKALDAAARWLEDNRNEFFALVDQRSRWWIPKQFNRRITAAIVDGGIDLLLGLRQPESDARQKFRQSLSSLIDEMMHSPEQRDQVNAIKNRLLDNSDVQAWLSSVSRELGRVLVNGAANSRARTRATLEHLLTSVGCALAADRILQSKLDGFLQELAEQAISWRGEISAFVVEVVNKWDATTLSDRLELVIGSDLQYIRMNGTIVGALVGSVIFLVRAAVA